ncbi:MULTISPECIES: hypothetical protein [Acidiphilium]|uniref:hypothetical protein n=1 Tax=Acidiphilium TaxID=522 RepID=UPI00257CEFCD|nr:MULTISPECIES: hypothetical protein [Acidiphilium]HQT85644.1 hypothetical protein [Acidiphilium rubrum]
MSGCNFNRGSVTVFGPRDGLAGTDFYPQIAVIIQLERSVAIRNLSTWVLHQTTETACDVASRPITAARSAETSRAH